VAKQLASLAALAPKRVLPAFGLQSAIPAEREVFTVPNGKRGAVFDESLRILRTVLSEESASYDGQYFSVTAAAVAPRPDPPLDIWLGGSAPAAFRRIGKLADGWLGNTFMPETAEVFLDELRAGAARSGRTLADLDLQVPVAVEFTDDVDEAESRHAAGYAFTIGAMGSGSANFYNEAFARQGFGDQVRAVQELWQAGRRDDAMAAVPRALGARTNLLGTSAMVRARLRQYRDAGVNTLSVKLRGSLGERLATLGQALDLVREINRE
jgi:alkanesulfonate monooxygenase SsuD/methylene tetrahydromethanopterin reductase-like flavin-dependent oxidoreductase (luciferase family)